MVAAMGIRISADRVLVALALIVALGAVAGPAQAGWSAPAQFATMQEAYRYDAVSDASGNVTAAWLAAGKSVQASTTGTSGGWSAVETVYTPPSGKQALGAPILATTPDGVMAAWFECSDPWADGDTCALLTSERTADGDWSAPDVAAADGVIPEGADVSVGSTRVATISWLTIPGSNQVRIATGTRNGGTGRWTWGSVQSYVTGFSRSTQVVALAGGGAMVAWHDDGHDPMRYVHRVSGTWTSVADISPDRPGWGEGWSPAVKLVVDGSGVITAVWNEIASDWNDPTNVTSHSYAVRAAQFDPGTETWGPPVDVTPTTHEGFDPAVAISPDGTITASWAGNTSLDGANAGVYASTFDGTTWSSPVRISPQPNASANSVRVLGTDGGALVAWQSGGSLWANLRRSGAWTFPITLGSGQTPIPVGRTATTSGWPVGVLVVTGDDAALRSTRLETGTAPTSPVGVVTEPEYESLRVSWSPPADQGAWGVESYTVVVGGRTCSTPSLSCTFDGLTNGSSYDVVVTARSPTGDSAAPAVVGTPKARNGWVGPLNLVASGSGTWGNGQVGTTSIAHNPTTGTSLVLYYDNGGGGPSYVAKIVDGDGTPSSIPAILIATSGPSALWYGSPVVQFNPGTGGWIVFYYEGPAGHDNGSTCSNTDGTENAGVVKSVLVAGDGTAAPARPVITDICAAGTLAAQWDAEGQQFLLAGSIRTAADGMMKLRSRSVSAAGQPLGDAPRSYGGFRVDQQSDLAFSPLSRRYLITGYAPSGGTTKALLLSSDGIALGIEDVPDAANRRASVAYDAVADDFVIVWGGASGGNDIRARRMNASTGDFVGPSFTVASAVGGRPRAVGNPLSGEVLVVWHDQYVRDGSYVVRTQRIATGGTQVVGSPIRISRDLFLAQRPSLTFNPAQCTFQVAFNGEAAGATTTDIYNRSVESTGCLSDPALHRLTVVKGGLGAGSVVSRPSGIDCGGTCAADMAAGVPVTLTATPAAGSTFSGWGGACAGATTTCTVDMTEARSVTAEFARAADEAKKPFRMSKQKPRQVGDVLISTFVVPEAGRIAQVGRVAGVRSRAPVCRTRSTASAPRRVVLRCRLQRGVLARQAARVRASAIPVVLTTTFTPAGGGPAVSLRVSVAVTEARPTPTPVTG